MPRAPNNLPFHFDDLIFAPQAERWGRGREGGRERETNISHTCVQTGNREVVYFILVYCVRVCSHVQRKRERERERPERFRSCIQFQSPQPAAWSKRASEGRSFRACPGRRFESLPPPAARRKSRAHFLICINAGICSPPDGLSKDQGGHALPPGNVVNDLPTELGEAAAKVVVVQIASGGREAVWRGARNGKDTNIEHRPHSQAGQHLTEHLAHAFVPRCARAIHQSADAHRRQARVQAHARTTHAYNGFHAERKSKEPSICALSASSSRGNTCQVSRTRGIGLGKGLRIA